jgi:hypothetical protein
MRVEFGGADWCGDQGWSWAVLGVVMGWSLMVSIGVELGHGDGVELRVAAEWSSVVEVGCSRAPVYDLLR